MLMAAVTPPPDISVVIVTYNNAGCVGRCLDSLFEAAAGLVAEVIVVDNHSTDATRAIIREEFPAARLVANPDNPGFAVAVNQGLALAASPNLLLLNSDVVMNRAALEGLVTACRSRGGQAFFSPRIVNPDGTEQATSLGMFPRFSVLAVELLLPYRLAHWLGWRTMFENRDARGTVVYEWLSGTCLAFTRAMLDRIGPLDTRFFMYYEDVDFCFRAVAQGFTAQLLPGIFALHIGGQSFAYETGSKDRRSYVDASLRAYVAKHQSRQNRFVLRGLMRVGAMLRRLRRTLFRPHG